MKRLALVLLASLTLAVGLAGPGSAAAPPSEPIVLVLFYGEGCPHCARERAFLVGLRERHPSLLVEEHEVWRDAVGRALFVRVAAEHGVEPSAVPTTFLGGQVWVGYDAAVGPQLEAAVVALEAGREPPVARRTSIEVPFLGTVDVGGWPVVTATLLIGFVDGINPCSLWVLSMLLALVLHSGSRRRVLAVGAVFLTVTATLYGIYIAGMFSALDVVGDLVWFRLLVVVVAGAFGLLHLREHVAVVTGRDLGGPSVSIPDARKPGIYRHMRSLAVSDAPLGTVLAGSAALAVGVSLVETPCTAGLPLLWANLLTDSGIGWAGRSVLFLLYLSVFLLDELVVFALAVITLRATKLQERHGAALQLVSGTLLVALALAMLVAPELMDTVAGTMVVFGLAGLVVATVLFVERGRVPRHRPTASGRTT